MTAAAVTKLFLFFLFTKNLIESYLNTRNKKHIIENRSKVPETFVGSITLEEHQKAADYTVAKINLGQVFNLFDLVILLLWTLGGGLNALDVLAHSFGYNPVATGVIFMGLFALISTVLGLPQSVYSTFVLEEKFGFNKVTPKLFIIDLFKGLIVGAIIGLPIFYGLLLIMSSLGDLWWPYAWGFLTLIQLVLLWAYPTFIAPIFNKFSEMEDGDVKNKVLDLLKRTGFKSNGLFVMNASLRSSHGNAYFTGLGENKRIVFFDTLIKTLNANEVEAVLAHELGHFKHKHVLKGLIKAIIFSFIGLAVLGLLYKSQVFFLGHGVKVVSNQMALLLFALVSGNYTFLMTPINAITSRKYEFEADAFASKHSKAEYLISSLVKLYKDNASTLTPDPVYSNFYHSHPPALTRVEHLETLK